MVKPVSGSGFVRRNTVSKASGSISSRSFEEPDSLVVDALFLKSFSLRRKVLRMIHEAGSGHPGGSLSVLDILLVLYNGFLRHDPSNPSWVDRDRFVLSAGHVCPALYVVLADQGYFDESLLFSLRKFGSLLQGHPEKNLSLGLENTSGPLGQGLSFAVGKAFALKKAGSKARVFCLVSDGEHNEGVVWESLLFAAHHGLDNLCVIVDRNNVQLSGFTEDIIALGSLVDKYESFGWRAVEVDGHDYGLLRAAFHYFNHNRSGKPFCIVANTVLGKGVSFMENNPEWHGKPLDDSSLSKALDSLRESELFYRLKLKGVIR